MAPIPSDPLCRHYALQRNPVVPTKATHMQRENTRNLFDLPLIQSDAVNELWQTQPGQQNAGFSSVALADWPCSGQ